MSISKELSESKRVNVVTLICKLFGLKTCISEFSNFLINKVSISNYLVFIRFTVLEVNTVAYYSKSFFKTEIYLIDH